MNGWRVTVNWLLCWSQASLYSDLRQFEAELDSDIKGLQRKLSLTKVCQGLDEVLNWISDCICYIGQHKQIMGISLLNSEEDRTQGISWSYGSGQYLNFCLSCCCEICSKAERFRKVVRNNLLLMVILLTGGQSLGSCKNSKDNRPH